MLSLKFICIWTRTTIVWRTRVENRKKIDEKYYFVWKKKTEFAYSHVLCYYPDVQCSPHLPGSQWEPTDCSPDIYVHEIEANYRWQFAVLFLYSLRSHLLHATRMHSGIWQTAVCLSYIIQQPSPAHVATFPIINY